MVTKITKEDIIKFREMQKEGLSYGKIGKALGFSYVTVRYHLDSEYADKIRTRTLAYSKTKKGKATRKRYNARPEVREKNKQLYQEYTRKNRKEINARHLRNYYKNRDKILVKKRELYRQRKDLNKS